ncbi:MAG: antitoxin [Spirochaetes bacterium GWF1_31_7]|nr:MAG: antitoxin [Spirochaetes bacterium GWE2_31_10]OHD48157.1 MAG: antitoxin [Spirochaetes bacterium GWF1_31_7]OHD83242.1 MAG: antitoxin [Spirochaetes bacterium RIFOXYB1_FULL_32_8]HBD93499.1 antitoxin [Spirochaetia bacterium]HBI37062.1 antitoxin [Spirochaetia bacterium]
MNEIEEKEIIDSVENGEWVSVDNLQDMKKKMMIAASETALKDYRINIRISKRDVEMLKTKALEEGLPYQTLVTSILHKYVTGKMVENNKQNFA